MKKIFKKILFLVVGIVLLSSLSFIEFTRKAKPTIRENITDSIFTIGDKTYTKALNNGLRVVKFGPMFFCIYPGGKAFRSKSEAHEFMHKNNWDSSKWDVFKLSGDYKLDVTGNNINKSLLVIGE